MSTENNFDEIFTQGITGIKKTKRQKRISRFNWEEGVLFEEEAERSFDPMEGIVEKSRETEIILDCGHSSSVGFGHVSECGHTVCSLCLQKFVFLCAAPGCFLKLCTVIGCENLARAGFGVYFCKKHLITAFIANLVNLLISGGRVTREHNQALRNEYYSIKWKINYCSIIQ